MIGLLIAAVSVSFVNSKVVLAANDSTGTETNYLAEVKTGIDKNNIKWSYAVCNDGTVSISKTEESDLSGEIDIPSKLEGYTVSRIDSEGLRGLKKITSIKIPTTVTSIGSMAFFACTSLENIEIPSSVTNFGHGAFELTPWLTNKTKSNPLVVVNNILVDGRYATGDITIPSNVTIISDGAFTWLDVEGENRGIYGNSDKITSVIIPEGVKKIGDYAFLGCINLTNINIPSTVTEIGDSAFVGCHSVSSFDIPNKNVKIGTRAFNPDAKVNVGISSISQTDTTQQGWHKDGEHWNWLWSNGTKRTGWYPENGEWYYFYGNGQMATEFIDLGGGYSYYLKPNSMDGKATMVTGWQYINGDWFYFNTNSDGYKGAMKRACWTYIGGKWYYFHYDGTMAHNAYIDGYYVDSSGAWV